MCNLLCHANQVLYSCLLVIYLALHEDQECLLTHGLSYVGWSQIIPLSASLCLPYRPASYIHEVIQVDTLSADTSQDIASGADRR
jgi:hypothetical protein